jgi:hypothetical protein
MSIAEAGIDPRAWNRVASASDTSGRLNSQ